MKGDKILSEYVRYFCKSRELSMNVTGSELDLQWTAFTFFLLYHIEGSLQNLEGQKGCSYVKLEGGKEEV